MIIRYLIRTSLVATILLLAYWSPALHAQDTYTSRAGGFAVAFPNGYPNPRVDSSEVSTQIGSLTMYTFLTEQASSACMVAYSDYPEEAFEGANMKALLDSARNGALNNVRGKLIRQKKISINGNPGLSVYFRGKSGATTIYGRFDYYIVTPRLYQIGFMALSQKEVDARNVKTYFSSFRLTSQEIGTGE